jgi:3-methyladenine DNA glycosylase AlkD
MRENYRAAGKSQRRKQTAGSSVGERAKGSFGKESQAIVESLRRLGNKRTRNGMARYGLPSDKAFGVPMGAMHRMAKRLGRNHDLARALWETGWYEARVLAAFIEEPDRVTPAQMDRWGRDFDSWGICDTVCFHLFDRTPRAFRKVVQWSGRRDEFVKRAAFALLASLALHDRQTDNEAFMRCLPLVERAATDDRNFVKKDVSWALRLIGRRNLELNEAALAVAQRLAASPKAAARWVGKDAFRELTSPKVIRRLEARRRAAAEQ